MASSFIHYNDNGFWAKDGFAEAFQLLLFEEIQLIYADRLGWLNIYKKELALQSLPLIYGGMSMCLNETLLDTTRKEIILQLLATIKNKIRNVPDYLTGKHLNELRKTVRHYLIELKVISMSDTELEKNLRDGGYGNELSVHNYHHGFTLLQNLIEGKLTYKADSEITYWEE